MTAGSRQESEFNPVKTSEDHDLGSKQELCLVEQDLLSCPNIYADKEKGLFDSAVHLKRLRSDGLWVGCSARHLLLQIQKYFDNGQVPLLPSYMDNFLNEIINSIANKVIEDVADSISKEVRMNLVRKRNINTDLPSDDIIEEDNW